MNDFLKNALAGRKKMVDEISSTTAIGQGLGSIADDKPTTSKLPFYTGDMVDKSPTGFTGILNQGATCYLNSMIQSLFMTPELREAVFEWRYDPNKDPEEKRCIPLQLQKLFAAMQISIKGAVKTKALTTSFGWTGREVYQQHDVLELSSILFENLETQAIGSKLAMVVSDLHRGSYKDYVQCLTCENMRGRNVPFVGLGLDISASNSFEEAMKLYITPEIMDGDNKVSCTKCDSKQDSKKGIRLTSLPYFLGIHLKRWTFDFNTLRRVKLTKKIPFPRRFDASDYLNCDGNEEKEKSEEDKPLEYELYSMMIHTGGASGGHYFAYIKDFKSGNWLQFNDSNVKIIPAKQIEEWFSMKCEVVEDKDKKKEIVAAPIPKKETVAAPIPKSEVQKKVESNSDGMDIGAAIAQNLKEKQDKKTAKKKLEEAKKDRPSFLHPFGAAYMLTYRLVDKERNVIEVSDDLIAENIREELEKEDAIYKKQKDEYDHLRQFITLKIHYDNKVQDVMVKKAESMKIALDTIYKEMDLKSADVPNIDCMRLRNMKVAMNVPLQPYDGDQLNDLIQDFDFFDPKHLILETKGINEEFAKYEKEKISLRMLQLDDDKMEWKKEQIVQVNEDAKIGSLRKAIAQTLDIEDSDRVRIAYLSEGIAILLTDDTKRIKKDERILNGHYVHIEICEKGTKHTEGKSKLMQKFDKQLNTLQLMYNEIEYDETKEDIYTLSVDIDARTKVGELRKLLAEKLKISVDELVLRKGFHQQELKDNNKTLEQYRLHTNSQVFVEKGKPLQPTQYLFQVYIEDEIYKKKKAEQEQKKWDEYLQKEMEKEKNGSKDQAKPAKKTVKSGIKEDKLGDAFLFVGDCVLDETWSMEKVKQTISEKVANVPPANKMRIRSFNDHNRLIKVYNDSMTLKENLKRSIKDFTQICCQETAKENETFTADKILLYAARWYPQRMDFGNQIEYAFNKKLKIKSTLKEELSKISGIPLEHIRVEHPRAYLLKNVENRRKVCILDWENEKCTAHSTLTGKQWKCKSGEFILYKDNREKEKLTKEDFETASIVSLVPRPEQALVFYTPEQQIEREKEEKLKKEKAKKEQEQAQKDAIERMKQSTDANIQKAQKTMEKSLKETDESTKEQ